MHYNVLDADNELLFTTWAEEGGSGQPLAFVLGKGCRAPRAWELALLGGWTAEECCWGTGPAAARCIDGGKVFNPCKDSSIVAASCKAARQEVTACEGQTPLHCSLLSCS